jgi:hypothetical protein
LSYWSTLCVGVIVLVLHVFWFVQTAHRAEVISGLGASIIALGIWIGARPYIRSGIAIATARAMPPIRGVFMGGPNATEYNLKRESMRPQVRRDVIAERVIAVIAVVLGTLVNGYSASIVRLLGLEG